MKRLDEVKEKNKNLYQLIEIASKENFSKKDLTNINLSVISDYLADISLTLAIIADKLGEESKE